MRAVHRGPERGNSGLEEPAILYFLTSNRVTFTHSKTNHNDALSLSMCFLSYLVL